MELRYGDPCYLYNLTEQRWLSTAIELYSSYYRKKILSPISQADSTYATLVRAIPYQTSLTGERVPDNGVILIETYQNDKLSEDYLGGSTKYYYHSDTTTRWMTREHLENIMWIIALIRKGNDCDQLETSLNPLEVPDVPGGSRFYRHHQRFKHVHYGQPVTLRHLHLEKYLNSDANAALLKMTDKTQIPDVWIFIPAKPIYTCSGNECFKSSGKMNTNYFINCMKCPNLAQEGYSGPKHRCQNQYKNPIFSTKDDCDQYCSSTDVITEPTAITGYKCGANSLCERITSVKDKEYDSLEDCTQSCQHYIIGASIDHKIGPVFQLYLTKSTAS